MSASDPRRAAPSVPGYTLTALLGRGGSGEVWRAVPRGGGEPVAVKLLVEGDTEVQAREAALLGALDHPHLVRLREVVHQPRRGGPPRVALVLDLLEGGSLADLLARRGRLRPGEVVTAVAPVAAALAHVHQRGVVHGDLSPGNVVFTGEGRPVLTDLGVARVVGEGARGRVTPAYVDPVVARGGAPGPASDVFGLAAAAFHALTGVAPWNGAAPADVLAVASSGDLPDLAELAPEAPAELRAVVARGLAADPHQRGSAAAFALDLRHACRPEPVRLAASRGPEHVPPAGHAAELTHQEPGRRPRPEPRIVVPPTGWRAAVQRIRPVGAHRPHRAHRAQDAPRIPRRPAVVAGAALAVAVAGVWAGTGGLSVPGPAGDPAIPVSAAAGSTGPPPPVGAPAAAPPSVEPDWAAVVARLYAARAAALTAGSAAGLDRVYAEGSALRSTDEAWLARLRDSGTVLEDFGPEVVEVRSARLTGPRVELELVDRWPAYALAREGVVARAQPARAPQRVGMVLVRDVGGWRILTARRLP